MTSDRASRKAIDASTLVIVWWIFWVISNLVGWYAFRESFLIEESIESYLRIDSLYLVSEILAAISVALTVPVVREIDKRQTKKVEVLKSLSSTQMDTSSTGTRFDDDGQDFQGLKP
jgi:hypothetical protein